VGNPKSQQTQMRRPMRGLESWRRGSAVKAQLVGKSRRRSALRTLWGDMWTTHRPTRDCALLPCPVSQYDRDQWRKSSRPRANEGYTPTERRAEQWKCNWWKEFGYRLLLDARAPWRSRVEYAVTF